jgi:hypothetical protein
MTLLINQRLQSKEIAFIAPDDLIVDWQPEVGEIVLFRDSDSNLYTIGMYGGLWNDVRKSSDGSFEASPYLPECMPYCGTPDKEILRAKVNYASKSNGEWFIDYRFDYSDVGYMMEYNRENLNFAIECNRLFRLSLNAEMEVAFGKVEAA